jgi:four helix bundle protein
VKGESSRLKVQRLKLTGERGKLKAEGQNQKMQFAYKQLEVWQRAVEFAVAVIDTVEMIATDRKHYRLLEQIEASSTSVAMNIAEGKGRYSKKEFMHFLYIARGSLYETMTLIEIFTRKGWIEKNDQKLLEQEGLELSSMLKGLINAIGKSVS